MGEEFVGGDLQSASNNLLAFIQLVYNRNDTKSVLTNESVSPTARTACAKEGGSTKFGGAPDGFIASGIVEGSMFAIAAAISALDAMLDLEKVHFVNKWL